MKSSSLQLRSSPPLLTGAALLVWGWQCAFLPYAFVMAVLLETSALISWRWAITDKEFNTLSDFSGLMFFIAVIYIFSKEGADGIFVILTVLPFILFPLLITQKYSEQNAMKLSALFVSLRKLDPELSPEANRKLDVSLPYFIICLVAASAGNLRTTWFFVAAGLLIVLMLGSARPKRYSISLWAGMICLSLFLAYAGQIGLRELEASIEARFMGIFDQFMWRYRDPNRNATAIGSLGRLKLSDRIVLRVKTKQKLLSPLLLREASYNSFDHGIWRNQQSDYSVIDKNMDASWTLLDGGHGEHTVNLSTYMVKEKAVIPLPHGSSKIKNVTAIEVEKNQYGTVLMDIREGWINYDVEYADRLLADSPADKNDLTILNYYRPDFDRLSRELQLTSMTAEQAVSTVYRFFQDNFRYSLNQNQRYPRGKYLNRFLFENRRGHCEYFATATALLLRAAGIPTRYVVGYAVDEYSSLEGKYIARARDAHSWVLVYVNAKWQVLDTTPSIWAPYEDENASAIEPLMDLWSWLSYTWSSWQSEDAAEAEKQSDLFLWLLLPLLALLAWRLYFKERIQRRTPPAAFSEQFVYPGTDSCFYQLVEQLEQAGAPRHNDETLAAWLMRIQNKIQPQQLQAALQLHNKYRFDPNGLSAREMSRLEKYVSNLLSRKQEWLSE